MAYAPSPEPELEPEPEPIVTAATLQNAADPAPASTAPTALAKPMAAASCALKVLTLNTHKGFTSFNRRMVLHELREAVRGVSADVVFLQEVIGAHNAHPMRYPRWPEVSQYEFLADAIWPAFAYGRNASYPEGHHGNALLSKFPIVSHHNHDVSIAGPERRGLLHCVIELPAEATGGTARRLHAICVHLGLHGAHRLAQMEMLCDLIAREVPDDAPLVVAGDFNDWRVRANRHLRERAQLREVFLESRGASARTFPVRWPLLRLDRIYVRNVVVRHLAVLSLRPWSHLSDHAGLLAEVAL
jgi:endonuclease/exonuclease/phosphatase family metal-dependent hydrolase